MGYILECQQAGMPEELLIPIEPPFLNHHTNEMDGGKKPATQNNIGEWVGLDDWNKMSTPWQIKVEADEAGANCGLILGCAGNTPAGSVAFAAVDIDLFEGQETHRNKIINYIASIWRDTKVLIRETVPYRALILIRIDDAFSTGRKAAYFLQYQGEEIGKIELLTTDQQCVIAGKHPSGNRIKWFVHGDDAKWTAPRIIDGMTSFPVFLDLAENIRNQLESLQGADYTYDSSSLGRGELVADAELVPEWLTVEHIIDLIKKTPNPIYVDRYGYVAFMEALAACKHGIEVRHGPFTNEQSERLTVNAAEWAATWPGNKSWAEAYAAERAKCDTDWFKQRGGFSTSWYRLTQLAHHYGYTEIAHDSAQIEFARFSDPSWKATFDPEELTPANANAIRPEPQDDVFSDDALCKHLAFRTSIGQVMVYIDENWLTWRDLLGWKVDKGNSRAKELVMDGLTDYTVKLDTPEQPLKRGEKAGLRSVTKRDHVMNAMEIRLLRRRELLKPTTCILQTRTNMYDLRTMLTLPMLDRKERFELRSTTVDPDFEDMDTPYFDMLLFGLADGNDEVVNWMWHYLGYSLLGDPRADCFVMIWGPGGNGKTVLTNVLGSILGGYQFSLNIDVLLASGRDKHPTSLYRLKDRRLAITSEMPNDAKWNEARLKQITGRDKIQARGMRQNEEEFVPEAALLMVCNVIPPFSRVTPALLRRFRVIGTTRQPEIPDVALEEKIIMMESSKILAKLMRYAQIVWNPNGGVYDHIKLPAVPAAMRAESESHLKNSDPVFDWLSDECDWGPRFPDCEEAIDELKQRYSAWLVRKGKAIGIGDTVNDDAFRTALKEVGVAFNGKDGRQLRRTVRTQLGQDSVNVCRGIRLKMKAA